MADVFCDNIRSYLLVSRDREVVVGCAYTHELNRMQSMCVGRTTGTVQLYLCLCGSHCNLVLAVIECAFALEYNECVSYNFLHHSTIIHALCANSYTTIIIHILQH